jgi:molecular chaperone GrpE
MSEQQENRAMDGETDVSGGFGRFGGDPLDLAGTVQPETESLEELTPERVADLKNKAAKADENWNKYVRISADFDNYKKRAAREKIEATKYANEALLERLIPILDNFEAAMSAANSAQGSNIDSLKTGVSMILSQFKNFLTDSGLEEIDAAGKPFDPNLHEAVSQQASADVPEGQVLQQLRKGYKLREKLIRPAMVIVSKKP